ncbi:MAG: ATP/GTP-binding protein [Candidatus Hadarchaeales archaeon]
MVPLNIVILGTAGSGKTTLTSGFGKWIKKNIGKSVSFINLDPGCESLPFSPDFDIREWFTIEKLMREEGLGPNGAMVRVSELLEENAENFSKRVREFSADIRLIDTPGQMEIFLFHGGAEFIKHLDGVTVAVFLLDAKTMRTSTDIVFARLLELSIGLELGVKTIGVINKIDQAKKEMEALLADAQLLQKNLEREIGGVEVDLALRLYKILMEFLPPARFPRICAKTCEGFQELYDIIYETFCACGDLT